MSNNINEQIKERLFEEALEENRLDLIAELEMGIYEASYRSFDELAEAVANKRFNEGPDGPQ
jgi:hypothetical protein